MSLSAPDNHQSANSDRSPEQRVGQAGAEARPITGSHGASTQAVTGDGAGGAQVTWLAPEASVSEPEADVPEEEMLELQERLKQIAQRQLELVQSAGLAFYKPHPKQEEFHNLGEKYRFRAFLAGNRCGKSLGGAAETCAYAIGERLWLPKDHPCRKTRFNRAVRILIVGENWDKVNDNFVNESPVNPGKLYRFLPPALIKSRSKNSLGYTDSLTLTNGTYIKLYTVRGFVQDPMSAESAAWDVIHFDEPPPEELWKALARGLIDSEGVAYFTMTSISQPWVWDLFMPPDGIGIPEFTKNCAVVQATTRDNPHLSESAISLYEATLNEDEVEARINGKQLQYQGLVYKNFSMSEHVYKDTPESWDDVRTPPLNYNIHISVDMHPQTPNAFVFMAVSPLGTCFIYDVVFAKTTVEDTVAVIVEKLKGRWHMLRRMIFDPIIFQTDPVHRTCLAIELKRKGLWMLQPAPKAKQAGIIKLRSVFQQKNKLFIGNHCKRWLYEISRYVFDSDNKPIDKDDHMMEATYRLFMPDPIYSEESTYDVNVEVVDPLENAGISPAELTYN